MFGLGTYFLWRQIKKAAGPYFDKKTKILLSNFKAAFSSTLTDLESAIVDESQSWHGGWTHDVIERQGGGKAESLDLRSVPLDVIEDSKAVAAALQVKLSTNDTLNAARTAGNVTPQEWTKLVDQFAPVLVKHAAKRAINRLADSRRNVFGGWRILTIAESEAYPDGKGGADYLTHVKFYDGGLYATDKEVKSNFHRANSMWSKRSAAGYAYRRRV